MSTKDIQKGSKEYQAPKIEVKEVGVSQMLCGSTIPEETTHTTTESVGRETGTWGNLWN